MTVNDGKNDDAVCWLLLSDVPSGTVIGLDANVWRVGCNFRGIRDIPLGVHYLFFSAATDEAGGHSVSGLRCSIFLDLTKPCVIRKRWVKELEEFEDQPMSESDVELMKSNQEEVSMYLGPYPKNRLAHWIALSSHITVDVINRLQPSGRYIFSCAQFQSEKSTSQERASLPIPTRLRRDSQEVSAPESIASGEEQLPVLKTFPETDLNLTKLPPHPLFPPGSSLGEISRHNMDQTYTLNHILSEIEASLDNPPDFGGLSPGESHLLGEFHFSFVIFLLGEVIEGWFHWRRLLSLLANCERAVLERPRLYKALITSLYRLLTYGDEESTQHKSIPEDPETGQTLRMTDLFNSGDSNGCFDGWSQRQGDPAFLPHTLARIFSNIASAAASDRRLSDLLDRSEGLRSSLERRFNVRLSGNRHPAAATDEIPVDDVDWDTDEAPVIVYEQ